jgi:hypothetical protein
MRIKRTYAAVLTLALGLAPFARPSASALLASLPARTPRAAPGVQDYTNDLEPERIEQLINSLAQLIEQRYIFEDVAKTIGERLRQNLWDGRYEGISLDMLAMRLTEDLRSVNNDLHLRARRVPPEEQTLNEVDPEEAARQQFERARRGNFGFARVEILEGNVGYLDLRGFQNTRIGGETAVAAMGFLANVDALIIDLRQNGGGSPSMVQLLTSYFFAEPTHLNSFQNRGQEQIDQFWTLPHVPGKKLVDTPLFVLTSAGTFSAAEEFTYNLKNLERATIVGQTTGGGAHPGGTHTVEGLMDVFVPDGRAINPITGTNWEGTGIEPHVVVPTGRALDEALRLAQE